MFFFKKLIIRFIYNKNGNCNKKLRYYYNYYTTNK